MAPRLEEGRVESDGSEKEPPIGAFRPQQGESFSAVLLSMWQRVATVLPSPRLTVTLELLGFALYSSLRFEPFLVRRALVPTEKKNLTIILSVLESNL